MKHLFLLSLFVLISASSFAIEPEPTESKFKRVLVIPGGGLDKLMEGIQSSYDPPVSTFIQNLENTLPRTIEEEIENIRELLKSSPSDKELKQLQTMLLLQRLGKNTAAQKSIYNQADYAKRKKEEKEIVESVNNFLDSRRIKEKLKQAGPGSLLDDVYKGAQKIYDTKERLAILESVYDQGIIGQYLQKKMEGLLESKSLCSAVEKCSANTSGSGSKNPAGLNDLFHRDSTKHD